MPYRPPSIIQHLSALQAEHGWLRDADLRALGERIGVPLHRIEGVASFYPHFRRTPPAARSVGVCRDLSCAMAGGAGCLAAIRAIAAEHEAASGERVEIEEVSCLGRCDRAPAALVDHHLPVAGADGVRAALAGDHHMPAPKDRFYRLDPYAGGGPRYAALRKIVAGGAAAADALLADLKAAGLRGMGGAGFPTATKWGFVRGAGPEGGGEKYVICNADESEPGTFKDREILAGLPHLVWEGVMIAAAVVGAQRGIVYIRHEYEPERAALEAERAAASAAIAELGLDLELEVFVSPGGYIMGEETALLEALEDRRGEPRNKPPFPGIEGLFGKPTV
ncbi:MAG: NAD(P)H-dependent oxidoreductase subunit E, partial [Myxococcales bacterium]|nr:NAD(P)H-dependent oxidoreductase subunit E [Myxococcales bacterium]